MKTYAECLKHAREKAELTQGDVAKILVISQYAVCKWERGEGAAPTIQRLIQLADIYDTSVDELVGRVSEA